MTMPTGGEGDWPRCPAHLRLLDWPLRCDLPEGHPGYHRDPLEGVEWTINETPL